MMKLTDAEIIRYIDMVTHKYGELSPNGVEYGDGESFTDREFDEIRVCFHVLPFLNVTLLRSSSYTLKHVVEAVAGCYISNGSLIVAAYALGMRGKVTDVPNITYKSGCSILDQRSHARITAVCGNAWGDR